MYHHLLSFTEDDSDKLSKRYHELVQKLEIGKDIDRRSIDEISEVMRVVLDSQQGLLAFWQQVQKDPLNHYHLHLVHPNKELLNLPWQLAIDTKRYPLIEITKSSTTIDAQPIYQPKAGPLKILVMISSPEDLHYTKRLSYEEEEEIILKSLASLLTSSQVQVHFTEDGSLENLKEKLQSGYYHILYFSGHGIYKSNTGYLQLENSVTLNSEEVTARELAHALKKTSLDIIPLIILSSCQTAQGTAEEGFRGVADELIHEGVPAVIAMAFSIKDRFNIIFIGHLYEHLAQGHPLPEAYLAALQDMQAKEKQELDENNRKQYFPSQWLIPQLYISQEIQHLVDWKAREQLHPKAGSIIPEGNNEWLLPHKTDYRFVGRRRECALLLNELINGKPVLVTGQAGIGKTALAEYLIKRLVIQDSEYHCFAFNESTVGVDSMATRLLSYLKIADRDYSEYYEVHQWEDSMKHLEFLIKRVRNFCKPVFVFDNLENCQQENSGPLRNEYQEWLEYLQQHFFNSYPLLFVGRFEIPELRNIFSVSLNQVPFVDFYRKCIQLELKNLHTQIRLPEMADVASLLYNMVGGNYRTLEFLNELYVNDPNKTLTLLKQIMDSKDVRIPAKTLMKDVHAKMETSSRQMVLTELIKLLTVEEQKTLNLLLHFGSPVLPLALEMQRPGKNFDADLHRLKNLTLIEEQINKETGHKLYLVAPFVKNSIEGIDLPQAYFYPEHAGDYHHKAFEIFHLYDELEEAIELYEWCRSIPKLNDVGVILTNAYHKMGYHDATMHYCKLVENIAGDKTDGDIINNIALTHWTFGNIDQALAYFTKFSIFCKLQKDDKKLGIAFNNIAQVHVGIGDLDTAMEWMEKGLLLSRATQHSDQVPVTLNNMGLVYCELKEYGKAMDAFKESLELRKKSNDRAGQINVLINICRIYDDASELQKTRKTLEDALAIALEINHKRWQGVLFNQLGWVLMRMMEYNAALSNLQKGLAISESVEDERETGTILYRLGLIYKDLKKYDEAIECMSKSSLLLPKFDVSYGTAILYHLGTIYIHRGDAAEALPFLQKALIEFREQNNMELAAATLYYIGDAYLYLDEINKSIKNLEECLSILKVVDDKETESMALTRLGQAYAIKDKPNKVLRSQERNLAIQQAAGDHSDASVSLYNMAQVYLDNGYPDLFLKYALEAYTIHAEANDLHGLYFVSTMLGTALCVHFPDKLFQEGKWLLDQAYEIGLMSSDFPAAEFVQTINEQFQVPLTKKKRNPGKKKTAAKKKSSYKKKISRKKGK